MFAGYGVEAPEYNWDDFKDVDVKGKTIIVLVNDPPIPDPAERHEARSEDLRRQGDDLLRPLDLQVRGGRAEGSGRRADRARDRPGRLSVRMSCRATSNEKFDIVTPDKNAGRANIEGWITLDAARKLFGLAGQDYDALKKQAATRGFKPVPLGVQASMAIKNTLRTIDSRNVVAKLEGSDPQLKNEYVVYSAHWDHLGVGRTGQRRQHLQRRARQRVGCRDGAGNRQGLQAAVSPQPKRSILFLMVTAEEQGLLGSQYYAVTPLYPLDKTVANINIDGVNQWGRTKDITVIGLGASDLDDYLQQARAGAGPDAERRSGAGERLLLPVGSFQLREAGRAGARSGFGHRLRRQVRRTGARRSATSTPNATITRRPTRSSRTGISAAQPTMPTCCSRSAIAWPTPTSFRSGNRGTSSRRSATRCFTGSHGTLAVAHGRTRRLRRAVDVGTITQFRHRSCETVISQTAAQFRAQI